MENVFNNDISNILKKVQITKASHQKNLKILGSIYEKVPYSQFKDLLFKYLRIIFLTNNLPTRNDHVERSLDFLANFIALVTPRDEENENIDEDTPLNPFLSDVIVETLKYHNICNESVRYNACLFVRLILQSIGYQTHLDNDICDLIEEAMLKRIMDRKSAIRLQAVMALVRLQDPLNPDCPVLKAYLSLIYDGNAQIRAEVVKNIAPFGLTIPHIIKRLKDIDSHVRSVTFRRCADLGPKHFKIVERQHILHCGINETHDKSKKVFLEHLLPKWLNAYNSNFILLLNSLKLDAEENDIVVLEEISKEVIDFFLRTIPINDFAENLHLTDQKLISIDKLSIEAVLLWNIVVNYLRHNEDLEEYLENILPELSPFCNYIESIIKNTENQKMEEWEYLEYQYMLYNLFQIAEGYDFSDEVGRKRLYQLIMNVLKDEQLQLRLMKKLVKIMSQLTSEDFINIMCHVISEIREPLVEVERPINKIDKNNQEFGLASLRVELHGLRVELDNALDCQEFLKANDVKQKIINTEKKIEALNIENASLEQVRVLKNDTKTVCRCLDLLIALLELPKVKAFTQSLVTVKNEFLMPLLNSNSSEINWRVLNSLALLSLLDEKIAEEYIKILCIPLITYRAIPNYNKAALLISVKSVCDLYLVYGPNVFGEDNSTSNTITTANTTKRRLYRDEDVEESIMNPARLHLELIIDIILDMMDDENAEIHDTAVLSITKLILGNFPVNSAFITRIILKWYNPLTAKCSQKFKQMLGVMIVQYASTIKGAKYVVAKAVIPILNSIAVAPKTSPLVDVDVDNLLHFLSVITTTDEQMDVVNAHVTLAHELCLEISKKTNATVVNYLTKMLTYLEVPSENANVLKELIAQTNIILAEEENLEKIQKKYVLKFLQKLNDALEKEIALESNNLGSIGREIENVDTNTNEMTDAGKKSVLDHNKHDSDKSQSIENLSIRLHDLQKEPNIDDKTQKTQSCEEAGKSISQRLKHTRNGKLKNTYTTDVESSSETQSSTDIKRFRRTNRNNPDTDESNNNSTTDSSSEHETIKRRKTKEEQKKDKQQHNSQLSCNQSKNNKKQVLNNVDDKRIEQSVNGQQLKDSKGLKYLKRSRRNKKNNDKRTNRNNPDTDESNNNSTTDSSSEHETIKRRRTEEEQKKDEQQHNSQLSCNQSKNNEKQVLNNGDDKRIEQSVSITGNGQQLKDSKELKYLKRSRRNKRNNDKNKSNSADSSSDTELEMQPAKKRLLISIEKLKSSRNNNVESTKRLKGDNSNTKKVVEVGTSNAGRSLSCKNIKNVRTINNVEIKGCEKEKSKNHHKSRKNKRLLKKSNINGYSIKHNNTSYTQQTSNNENILRNNQNLTSTLEENTMNSKCFVPITQSTKNSSSLTSNSFESHVTRKSNRTTRSSNLCADLNSSAETTLHTIIYDCSHHMSLLHDDSVSSTKGLTPRRSLRMKHSNTSSSNDSTRSSTRRNKQKNSRVSSEFVSRFRRKIETKR